MMELLNNIWMALSTPNQNLLNFLYIPLTIIEILLTMYIIIYSLNIFPNKKQKTIYLTSLVCLINQFIIPEPYNIFSNYIMALFIIHFSFKLDILKTVFAIFIYTIIFSLIGNLILNPFITLTKISYESISNIPIYRIAYLMVTYMITYIICLLLKHKNLSILMLKEYNRKTKLIVLSNIAFGLIAISIQIFFIFNYIDTLPIIYTFLNFISLFVYFGISIYSLTRVTKLTLTTQKLENAEEYNKTLHILHDSVRGFKHDFDNIVTTIGGYVKTNDMEGLKNYYVQLEDDCQKVNNLYLLNPEIINNPGIYNLLTNKYYDAESKDTKVNMTFLLDLNTLKMKIYEFARILGILLDNAIEASEECNEKIINITFRYDDKNNRQLIIIENTYNNKDVDTEKIFGKGISEKENHTGLGLWEVQNIIKKNNNINLYTSKNNKFFIQQLEIY